MLALSAKHALITGGGTGLGAAIAVALSNAGIKVTVTGRRQQPLDTLAANHEGIQALPCDVTDEGSVIECFSVARKQSGPIDIAVANAGSALAKPFLRQSTDDLKSMLDVNLTGVFNVWKAAAPDMKTAGWGRLIAIASTAGLKGYPYVSAYCAAKHGVVGLTRALALEFGKTGVTVNSICPGYAETELLDEALVNISEKTGMTREKAADTLKQNNPQKRFIQPQEVAETVLWLCNEQSGSMNGLALPVAGGEI